MNRNKILYIGGFELPDKNAAAQRIVSNAKLCRDLGYEVTLIGVDKSIKSNGLSKKFKFEDFDCYSIKYPRNNADWMHYLTNVNYIYPFTKSGTVSHILAYNYPAIALHRLKIFCNSNKIKVIGDCTEWYEAKGNFIFRLIKGMDVYLRMRVMQTKLDGLIVISDYLYEYYRCKVRNLVNIPPLVDLSMGKWKVNNKELNNNPISLIYAGSPGGSGKDRIDTVINVLSEIRKNKDINVLFNVIGITKNEYQNIFKIKTLPQHIDEFVSFKGRLSHIETLKEIGKSNYQVFVRDVNLSNTAGFPTKYVEAISCGTPVLTNTSSNIEKFFKNGKTGYILDISSYEKLKVSLLNALTIDKEVLKVMKNYCSNSRIFHYLNYAKDFQKFLHSIE